MEEVSTLTALRKIRLEILQKRKEIAVLEARQDELLEVTSTYTTDIKINKIK